MTSLWTETASMPTFPPLDGDRKTEVLVIGGGITGLLIAHAMKEAGIPCILAEARRLCGGVTADTTAKITSQHGLIYAKLLRTFGPEFAKSYWLANENARRRYEELARTIPCDFARKDAFVYSLTRPVALQQELLALEQLGIPADYIRTPRLPLRTAGAICFRNQAQFHPLRFLAALASGLDIHENTEVRSFEGRTVRTHRGRITAEHIVVATHFPLLNTRGLYPLKLYQDRSYVLALEGAEDPEGMYVDEAEDGLSFRTQGNLLLLGGGSHRTGKPGEGWAPMEAFSRQHYPRAVVRGRWATQDCITLDGVPYIGHYSRGTPTMYVATGFNKWGMTSAMTAALLLRDMVQGRENPFAPVFSPQRSIFRPQLFRNALEAAGSLLTVSGPRCPHLGCALKWNPQEHSWDCACHGSRFAGDGSLLNNPATGALSKSTVQKHSKKYTKPTEGP